MDIAEVEAMVEVREILAEQEWVVNLQQAALMAAADGIENATITEDPMRLNSVASLFPLQCRFAVGRSFLHSPFFHRSP